MEQLGEASHDHVLALQVINQVVDIGFA